MMWIGSATLSLILPARKFSLPSKMSLLPLSVHDSSPLACSLTNLRRRSVSHNRPPGKAVRVCRVQRCMATQTAAAPPSRRSANYPPSAWDDGFIQSLPSDFMDNNTSRVAKLKEEVRNLIVAKDRKLVEQLELVDALRQLGVSYHFEKEIRDMLATISRSIDATSMAPENDLYATALFFRLMREHGFDVSQGTSPARIDSCLEILPLLLLTSQCEIQQIHLAPILNLRVAQFRKKPGKTGDLESIYFHMGRREY